MLVHFHDLVALINEKIDQIRQLEDMTAEHLEVVRALLEYRRQIMIWCQVRDDDDCGSYVYYCPPWWARRADAGGGGGAQAEPLDAGEGEG